MVVMYPKYRAVGTALPVRQNLHSCLGEHLVELLVSPPLALHAACVPRQLRVPHKGLAVPPARVRQVEQVHVVKTRPQVILAEAEVGAIHEILRREDGHAVHGLEHLPDRDLVRLGEDPVPPRVHGADPDRVHLPRDAVVGAGDEAVVPLGLPRAAPGHVPLQLDGQMKAREDERAAVDHLLHVGRPAREVFRRKHLEPDRRLRPRHSPGLEGSSYGALIDRVRCINGQLVRGQVHGQIYSRQSALTLSLLRDTVLVFNDHIFSQ
mmetsp:Transcript_32998/g.74462  ORF Transcript_32998/g.74462 Transcript_32998/m.74462 type:complete len:265 (-) Transcript_32998:1190-1984(-)